MRRWNSTLVSRARRFRREGLSYTDLAKRLGFPRSTIHYWLRGIKKPRKFDREARLKWIKQIQPMGALANKTNKIVRLQKIDELVRHQVRKMALTKTLKKSLLSFLYLAEGSKTGGIMQFVNTDPTLVKFFVEVLRECYEIDERRLRLRLHLHEYHDEPKVKKFWSNLLRIPPDQFHKTFIKTRSKERSFRRNFGGICFVRYNSVELKEQIIRFGRILLEKKLGKIKLS